MARGWPPKRQPDLTAHERAEVFALLEDRGWEPVQEKTPAYKKGDYFCRVCMYDSRHYGLDAIFVEAWKIITPKRYRAMIVFRDGHTHVVQVNLSSKRRDFDQVIPLGVDQVSQLKEW